MNPAVLPPLQVAQTRCGRLGYVVSGEGEPTLVLVNGAGMSLEGWAALYPAIESLGTVFAYNRFGVKGSDAPQQRQTGTLVVAALRELLGYAGLAPPYVLVAHSLGCVFAELFASLHPAEVEALVLVEPTFPEDPRELRAHEERFVQGTSKALALPPGMVEENLHSELACLHETMRELAAAGPPPAVPREVVHGGGGHFPQLTEPSTVLAALARVVKLPGHRRAAAD